MPVVSLNAFPATDAPTAYAVEPQTYDVTMSWDEDACVWVAVADDIPLALESASFDTLVERVRLAAPEILQLNAKPFASLHLRFLAERVIADG